MRRLLTLTAALTLGAALNPSMHTASAQSGAVVSRDRVNFIAPQARSMTMAPQPVRTTRVHAQVCMRDRVATTTLKIEVRNESRLRQEAEFLLAIPDGATLRGFAIDGPDGDIGATLLASAEATAIYEGIVRTMRDPGLLEFVGSGLVRSRVFPVEPGGVRMVTVAYEQLLSRDGDRIEYSLPRSEALEYDTPWSLECVIEAPSPVRAVYSPSHAVRTRGVGARRVTASFASGDTTEPGPIRLTWLTTDAPASATAYTYPAADFEGGYFLLLAGAGERDGAAPSQAREVTIVIDKSGSMGGEKIAQAIEAARQTIHGLRDGERFNIIAYNDQVHRFAPASAVKDAESTACAMAYLDGVAAGGGTNLHDALDAALEQPAPSGALPIVLFLTDGMPTVGNTSETAIRALATDRNGAERRVFTFGVGADVNTPLLRSVAVASRATATFVLPGETVEVKLGGVFAQLQGPVLTSIALDAPEGRIADLAPDQAAIPDLFSGEEMILTGRYLGSSPFALTLTGAGPEGERTLTVEASPADASRADAFVGRLWASRRIGALVERLREHGAEAGASADDPIVKELTDEIVRLSIRHGVLTEYTAFLAREDVRLADADTQRAEARDRVNERALPMRSGMNAMYQTENAQEWARQDTLNRRNYAYDGAMNRVALGGVQQIADRALFERNGQWIDSRLASRELDLAPDEVVEFGSEAHGQLVERLAREGRQALLALVGDMLIEVDGRAVLVRAPEAESE
ncbi:MAG: VWA domain-containing protein [Phycisphaerales bacterium]